MNKKLNCVLLVDDDLATNFLNNLILEEAAIAERIETVLNGNEAIQFLTNTGKHTKDNDNGYPRPALIFLDINMPVMDGWEFLEAYHNLSAKQKGEIIIVMLSASLNPDDKQRTEGLEGVSGFKNKPLSLEMIQEVIANYFPGYL